MDSETKQKIQELQVLEHNMQNLLMQKQTFEIERNEILNALQELKKSDDEVYRVLGSIMLKANKPALEKELEEKNKILDLRLNSIEKQEKLLQNKAQELHEDIKKALKFEEKK